MKSMLAAAILSILTAIPAAAQYALPEPLVINLTVEDGTIKPTVPANGKDFDPKAIAALIDDRDIRKSGKGLTLQEIRVAREKLLACWMLPASTVDDIGSYYAELHVTMKPDGKPAGKPVVAALRAPNAAAGVAFEAEAMKVLDKCSPYGLPEGKHDLWERIIFRFDAMGRHAATPTQAYRGPVPDPAARKKPASPSKTVASDEINKLREAFRKHWSAHEEKGVVTINVKLDKSGNAISVEPVFYEGKPRPSVHLVQAAITAVYKAMPLDFLPAEKYEMWKDLTLDFDTEVMKQ